MAWLLLVGMVATGLVGSGVPADAVGATPNDPLFGANQWGPKQIKAVGTTGGQGIVIGVVDSGIDFDHEDLSAKVIPGATFLACPGNPAAGCGNGDWESGPAERLASKSTHGTHVAGIAAATTNNGIGIAGVAPDAKLLAVKVLDTDGGSFEDIAAGIRYAADQGVHVINLSLGVVIFGLLPGSQVLTLTGEPSEVDLAIQYAQSRGVVVVAAAGNESFPLCADPAFASGALCVTATDRRESRAAYSNEPLNTGVLGVAAPGGGDLFFVCREGILSTVPAGTGSQSQANVCGYPQSRAYTELSGTSMAAPHVAGQAALLRAAGCTPDQTIDLITGTARQPFTSPAVRGAFTPVYGFGIVDAEEALLRAASVCTPPPPNQLPQAVDDIVTATEDVAIDIAVLANDSDPDGQPLTISAVTQPVNGSVVNNGDGTVTYTPDTNFNGSDVFTYAASDGIGTDTASVTVTVVPVDDPPVTRDDRAFFQPGTATSVDVLANDADPEGDPMTVAGVTQPANGTATSTPTNVAYLPAAGFGGADRFDYTASSSGGTATATVHAFGTACLEVFSDDIEGNPTVDEDNPFTRGWMTDIARNDNPATTRWFPHADAGAHSAVQSWFSDTASPDLKDDRLIAPVQSVGPATHLTFWHRFAFEAGFDGGVLEASTDGGFSWQDVGASSFVSGGYNGAIAPDFGSPIAGRAAWTGISSGFPVAQMERVEVDLGRFAGHDVFVRWRLALDPAAVGATSGFGWHVDDVALGGVVRAECLPVAGNALPVAVDDARTTMSGTAIGIDVLANDTDPDGDSLRVFAVSEPAHGMVENDGSVVTYTPEAGFRGLDTFVYTISDGRGGMDSAVVTVTVNDPPTAADDSATTRRNVPVKINVLANDADPEGQLLTLTENTQGANGGVVSCKAAGECKYRPRNGFLGTDTFEYTVCDPAGACATALVSVNVVL